MPYVGELTVHPHKWPEIYLILARCEIFHRVHVVALLFGDQLRVDADSFVDYKLIRELLRHYDCLSVGKYTAPAAVV